MAFSWYLMQHVENTSPQGLTVNATKENNPKISALQPRRAQEKWLKVTDPEGLLLKNGTMVLNFYKPHFHAFDPQNVFVMHTLKAQHDVFLYYLAVIYRNKKNKVKRSNLRCHFRVWWHANSLLLLTFNYTVGESIQHCSITLELNCRKIKMVINEF